MPNASAFTWTRILSALGVKGQETPRLNFDLQPVLLAGDVRQLAPAFDAPQGWSGDQVGGAVGEYAAIEVQPVSDNGCIIDGIHYFQTGGALIFKWLIESTPLVWSFGPSTPAIQDETLTACRTIVRHGRVGLAPATALPTGATYYLGGTVFYPKPIYVPPGKYFHLVAATANVTVQGSVRVLERPTLPGSS